MSSTSQGFNLSSTTGKPSETVVSAISTYDDFKQLKKYGISRKQKLNQMKQSIALGYSQVLDTEAQKIQDQGRTYTKYNNKSGFSIDKKDGGEQSSIINELLKKQETNSKSIPVSFEAISQELLTSHPITSLHENQQFKSQSINKFASQQLFREESSKSNPKYYQRNDQNEENNMNSEVNSNKEQTILFDQRLIEKAKPLIQKHTTIDLEISDPQYLPKFQGAIEAFRNEKNQLIQQSVEISSFLKVQKNNIESAYPEMRNENQGNYSEPKKLNINPNPFELIPYQNQEQQLTFKSPFDTFSSKQSQMPTQQFTKTANMFPQQLDQFQYGQNDYQYESPNKPRVRSIEKKYDFSKLNFKQQNPEISQSKLMNTQNQINQNISMENRARNENLKKNTKIEPKNKIVSREIVLFPEMYNGSEYLQMPDFLEMDQLETFISDNTIPRTLDGDIMGSSPISTIQDDVIFSQISPYAREILKNSNQKIIKESPASENKNIEIFKNQIEDINFTSNQSHQAIQVDPQEFLEIQQQEENDHKIPEQTLQKSPEVYQEVSRIGSPTVIGQDNSLNLESERIAQILDNQTNKNIGNPSNDPFLSINLNESKQNQIILTQNNVLYEEPVRDDGNAQNIKDQYDEKQNIAVSASDEQQQQRIIEKGRKKFEGSKELQQYFSSNSIGNSSVVVSETAEIVVMRNSIEKVLLEIEGLQSTRTSGRLSQSQMYEISRIVKSKLSELLEFVRYDAISGEELFPDLPTEQFLKIFPLIVEKIKGQTIAGFSKIKLFFVFFQNLQSLIQSESLKQTRMGGTLDNQEQQNVKQNKQSVKTQTNKLNGNKEEFQASPNKKKQMQYLPNEENYQSPPINRNSEMNYRAVRDSSENQQKKTPLSSKQSPKLIQTSNAIYTQINGKNQQKSNNQASPPFRFK